ncbi:cell division protein ZipA C-terminal FtsZ-binding domain-containing protein [Flagellimonas sp. DF-77]|uniref:cell division protein ZipA C-terminal FtsZ-binding domain-containing protein n=1 Tax=Flagellimonas algarum TaxID=3230298 RepID=UPI0033943B95
MRTLCLTLTLYCLWGLGFGQTTHDTATDLVISTAGQSDERAEKVLSLQGSEDRRDLLQRDIDFPELPIEPDSTRYFANAKYDWILTLEPKPGQQFERQAVFNAFDRDWSKEQLYPTIYAKPANSANWTYFHASDNQAEHFDKIAIAWKLFDSLDEPPIVYDEARLTQFENTVRSRMKKLKVERLRSNCTVKEAATHSNRLSRFITENNQWAIIVLQADKNFEGTDLWDVMQSVGLRWGDMDLFHWDNEQRGFGDDYVFSVWTSTAPGYFFPEEIAAGRVQVVDLIFGFSIPRTVAPEGVFEVMHKVTQYAQKRLGGRLLDGNGNPLEPETELARISAIAEKLETAGLQNGIGDALYLFQ